MYFHAVPDMKSNPCRGHSLSKLICSPKGLDNKVQRYRDEHNELGSNAWMMLPVEFLLGFFGETALMSNYRSGFRVAERGETPNIAIAIKIEAELKRFPRAKAVSFSSVSRCQCYTQKTQKVLG